MAAEHQSNSNNPGKGKKRKQRYLPHNKPVKKGSYPLRPGVEGFFITCDGGRESQASHEAINLLDSFLEELVEGECSAAKKTAPSKQLNKITKFTDSDSSSSDDESTQLEKQQSDHENLADDTKGSKGKLEAEDAQEKDQAHETEDLPLKRQRVETDKQNSGNKVPIVAEEKSIDKLIEAEIEELGDRNKRHFVNLDTGCNGCIFIQIHKRAGEPGPAEIAQYVMKSAAASRKHMSRFLLRVLPVEVACYASEEEITQAIVPLIAQHFPTEAQTPYKFAVLFEARANTGIDRMKIINAVAKSVPAPHKVNLSSPDKTIIVQIAKTICMVGIIEKYKELAKFNLRQLTSSKE
ncbi:hypothetical protein H6P81_003693 [Aristolochia fimbriata]|uniref:THUMP domain-containing protein n=1 Tax=Aristolochia fimbriata TaxID=158543 RepID=A0AAV7FDC0_ARIFI|nr:hypothetical protein H6P81_003693 [Aristolochia fimbriata]